MADAHEGDTVHFTVCRNVAHDRIYTKNPRKCCKVEYSLKLGVKGMLPPPPPLEE